MPIKLSRSFLVLVVGDGLRAIKLVAGAAVFNGTIFYRSMEIKFMK